MKHAEGDVKGRWGQVENVYRYRMELIPILVRTVEGAANYEKNTLAEVVEAHSNAGCVQLNAEELTEDNIARFQQAQDNLDSALQRSIPLIVERHPELAATRNFCELQAQIEGTANCITVTRHLFNATVEKYNKLIRTFPYILFAGLFDHEKMGCFTATTDVEQVFTEEFEQDYGLFYRKYIIDREYIIDRGYSDRPRFTKDDIERKLRYLAR